MQIRSGPAELDLGGRQQRLVLALLLARAGSTVSLSELVDTIWEDDPPASAVNIVHRSIGALRRLVEPDLPVRATGRYLTRQAAGYQLRVGADRLDLLRFRSLVTRARRTGDPVRAVRLFTDALALWQGRCATGLEPVAGSQPAFVALESERSHAARDAADQALRAGLARAVIPALRHAAGLDPLDEALQARLLLALAADGRQAEAFDLFRALRRRLDDELGIGPGPELQAAYDRLLHPDGPAATLLPAPAVARRRRRVSSRPRNRVH
ncbi:winged helix-turn-helix domain-containing protein [Actinoplanes sp. TRM 88003]|uniref:Winged helix-turn-helix domain-containing protein n=1 Tax=Paractinoplanes aksuensis TaxID=2939490 RepID=A0ABT1E0X9_9ACTN|nr:BTAD domain-containing putative transcriptional regulator [Actinoplanes aksuensis]MCO8276769.1 winged helix-turn-helix domain-containing protein [Actinoplanes aksuensis]